MSPSKIQPIEYGTFPAHHSWRWIYRSIYAAAIISSIALAIRLGPLAIESGAASLLAAGRSAMLHPRISWFTPMTQLKWRP